MTIQIPDDPDSVLIQIEQLRHMAFIAKTQWTEIAGAAKNMIEMADKILAMPHPYSPAPQEIPMIAQERAFQDQ